MNSTNIYHNCIIKQDAKVGTLTKRTFSVDQLIENLIREHGTYANYTMHLDANNLPLSDKRLLISHFESAEWYEYACGSAEKTNAIFEEHESHIQKLINDSSHSVYVDAMEEMRSYK